MEEGEQAKERGGGERQGGDKYTVGGLQVVLCCAVQHVCVSLVGRAYLMFVLVYICFALSCKRKGSISLFRELFVRFGRAVEEGVF